MASETSSVQQRFAAAVRARRIERGLSQEQLAHRAGVTAGTVVGTEGCRTEPRLTTVVAIAEALELDIGQLAS